MITAKIDVTLIDKSKLFPGSKPNTLGKCPQYLDVVMFENKHGPDPYGNTHVVVQSLSKEERDAGKKGAILGNAKVIKQERREPEPEINRMRNYGKDAPQPRDEDDDVPF